MKALYQDLTKSGLWLPCKLVDYDMVRDKNANSHAIEYEGEIFGVFASEVKLINETNKENKDERYYARTYTRM